MRGEPPEGPSSDSPHASSTATSSRSDRPSVAPPALPCSTRTASSVMSAGIHAAAGRSTGSSLAGHSWPREFARSPLAEASLAPLEPALARLPFRRGSDARRRFGARPRTCVRFGKGRRLQRRIVRLGRRPRPCPRLPAPPDRRQLSATFIRRSTALTRRSDSGSSEVRLPSKYLTTGEVVTDTPPRKTSPLEPSMDKTSPSSTSCRQLS